ncbi:hypothetical protein RQM59_03350 [Flavobacteriaceae bacterium S356]|uniref:Uncharacterized protein n=1 Tax=Asprobacillus argus TaxID=3076534 RepID=A0ABU3LDW5_9FLAO|nr:hypothetical protein [Flavobacteriaceae bacterium S356]
MKNQKINTILTTLSLIVLLYYIFIVIDQLYYSKTIKIHSFSSLFGNIIVSSIFIINNLFIENLKRRKVFQFLLKGLLLTSVIFLGILFYEMTTQSFFDGEDYFWKFSTIIFGVGSIILIQASRQKLTKKGIKNPTKM